MKLTPGVYFINVSMSADSKSAKKQTSCQSFLRFWNMHTPKLLIKCWWNWPGRETTRQSSWVVSGKNILKVWNKVSKNLHHFFVLPFFHQGFSYKWRSSSGKNDDIFFLDVGEKIEHKNVYNISQFHNVL